MQVVIEIADKALDLERFRACVPSDGVGASVEFCGIVRRHENGKSIEGLHYEAYLSMAKVEMQKIVQELAAQYRVDYVGVYHRIGWVRVGEIALFLQVFSGHRGENFSFCAEFINRLKQTVPIWKMHDPHA